MCSVAGFCTSTWTGDVCHPPDPSVVQPPTSQGTSLKKTPNFHSPGILIYFIKQHPLFPHYPVASIWNDYNAVNLTLQGLIYIERDRETRTMSTETSLEVITAPPPWPCSQKDAQSFSLFSALKCVTGSS